MNPKVVQGKIDSQPREKALQVAAEEKVAFGQLGIRQRAISGAASEAIDLATFKAKEGITTALSLLEEAKGAVDQLRSSSEVCLISRRLRRASTALNSWDHTQVASLATTGVYFAGMATVDVGARAVHSGLHSLRAQALRVGTSALPRQAEQLTKLADSFLISTRSLFGEGLQLVIAKATSSASIYADMEDGFVQAGLVRPRPPVPNKHRDGRKRKGDSSPLPFLVLGVASPSTRAGATGPPLGGNHSTEALCGAKALRWLQELAHGQAPKK